MIIMDSTNFPSSPYKFEAPWSAWEFSYHVLHKQANLVILSMAWLTREDPRAYSRTPKDPDMDTLSYWLARLEPIIRAETEGEIICVLANRCGTEEEATYAGTSCVLGIQAGEVKVYGILGRSEKELLVIDTNKRPQAKLVSMPASAVSNTSEESTADSTFSNTSNTSDASGLTVDTACTSPTLDDVPMTMADVMTPITPADPNSPNAYFNKGKQPETDNKYETLKSSIAEPGYVPEFPDISPDISDLKRPESRNATPRQSDVKGKGVEREQGFSPSLPDSPTFQRDPPPRPQNASQTRQPDEREALREALKSSIVPPVFTPPLPDSPTFQRPTSPKSRNASRTRQPEKQEPALISHDLAKEEQITQRAIGVKSPLQPTAALPERYQSSFTTYTFGSRSQYIIPRPKSAVW
jgi:hypothetical protein